MAKEMRVYVPPELKGQVEELAELMNLSPTKVGQIALSLGLRKLFLSTIQFRRGRVSVLSLVAGKALEVMERKEEGICMC